MIVLKFYFQHLKSVGIWLPCLGLSYIVYRLKDDCYTKDPPPSPDFSFVQLFCMDIE